MARRTQKALVDLRCKAEWRLFSCLWDHTRETLIEHWDELRAGWRRIDRPAAQDFGIGDEPTFLCWCNRSLPTYLAQVDHVLSQEEMHGKVIYKKINPPHSPGPVRQILYYDADENGVITRIDGRYLVEYQINPKKPSSNPFKDQSIGRYSVEAGTGLIRIEAQTIFRREPICFEYEPNFFSGGAPTMYTTLTHAGDPDFKVSLGDLLKNDLKNLQLLCGPCNASKQEKSYHLYKGQPVNDLLPS